MLVTLGTTSGIESRAPIVDRYQLASYVGRGWEVVMMMAACVAKLQKGCALT